MCPGIEAPVHKIVHLRNQISLGLADPFTHPLFPRFEYVMKGIKRSQVWKEVTSRLRLPIIPAIICKIFGSWDKAPTVDTVMLKVSDRI